MTINHVPPLPLIGNHQAGDIPLSPRRVDLIEGWVYCRHSGQVIDRYYFGVPFAPMAFLLAYLARRERHGEGLRCPKQ